jgi:hypothetical protein
VCRCCYCSYKPLDLVTCSLVLVCKGALGGGGRGGGRGATRNPRSRMLFTHVQVKVSAVLAILGADLDCPALWENSTT